MKLKLLVISILIIGLSSCCNNEGNDCSNTVLEVNQLETEYGCTNIDIDLSENYMFISNPLDFSEFVNANCQYEVDFTTYDLVVGKKVWQMDLFQLNMNL